MSSSEDKMRILLQRFQALEQTVNDLAQKVQKLGKARRDASLLEVDQIERAFELTPRTAELRRRDTEYEPHPRYQDTE